MNEHPVVAMIRGKLPDPARSFTIVADLKAQPGRGAEVVAGLTATQAIRLTRAEPGCLAYDVLRDVDFPDRFVAYETWRDLASLQDHLGTAHFAAVGAALAGLLAEAPGIRILLSQQ
jgi:quinol monooxygenase YgiN